MYFTKFCSCAVTHARLQAATARPLTQPSPARCCRTMPKPQEMTEDQRKEVKEQWGHRQSDSHASQLSGKIITSSLRTLLKAHRTAEEVGVRVGSQSRCVSYRRKVTCGGGLQGHAQR